jgi:hypothetical protein
MVSMPDSEAIFVKRRVRSMALWAGIGAVLLLYFGYSSTFGTFDTLTLQVGTAILEYTFKIGGWGLALATVGLAIGQRAALAYDALVTALIGVCFLAGGGSGLVGGAGSFSVLYILFGVIFVSAGRHSWLEYRYLGTVTARPAGVGGVAQPWLDDAPPEPPVQGSLAGRILERTRTDAGSSPGATDPAPASTEPPAPPPAQPEPDPEPGPISAEASDEEPPPEGFLAQFGEEDPPRRP